ncbi:hypothetical protein BHE74_00032903 [Ensete ventricosum]|nr:hypothetical protein GW17_00017457 [Ensete ventricosum]RWW60121.1 hypothetical protein BHE74_00032903 [Ensete ventricosum]
MCCRGRTTAASRLRVKDAARWRRRRRRLFYGDMTTLKAPPALFYGLRWRVIELLGVSARPILVRVHKSANVGEDRYLRMSRSFLGDPHPER